MEEIKKVSVEEEVKSAYIDYAMSVIAGRAIPDVRDGLKPVQRRILYSMYELGLFPGKPYKKSARVVGECFVKGTLVYTENGLKPIEKIERGENVYTEDGLFPVKELYIMPPQTIYEVKLENGLTNRVTGGQMFKVLDDSLNIVWKRADQLKEGDYIVLSYKEPNVHSYVKVDDLVFDEDLAYFTGLFLADGWIDRDKRGYKRISFGMDRPEPLEKINQVLEKLFGYRANITKKNNLYILKVNRKVINEKLISALGLEDKKSTNIRLPEYVMLSPKSVVFSFLSGYIDADGSIHKDRKVINIVSTSQQFINQLQVLILSYGIISRSYKQFVKEHTLNSKVISSSTVYVIEISGNSYNKTVNLLNLYHPKKKDRLVKIDKKSSVSKYEEIPFLGRLLFEEFSQRHLGGGWYLSAVRYSANLKDKVRVYISSMIKLGIYKKAIIIGSKYKEFLERVVKNNLLFIKVKSIKQLPPEITYDIEVEEKHEFIANGMLVHNCLGKYHPHGDTSVYDALVRMAQDFTMRYPLIDGQGNFGSIDGDPQAAMRYCLTGETLVNTNMGIIKIKDIVPSSKENSDNPIDILVQSVNRKINRATMFFNSGKHDTLKVETSEGFEIEGSFNHPVLVLDKNEEGKPIYKWKTLDKIKVGDYLVVSRTNEIDSHTDHISEEEAILLGSFVSEGYVSDTRAGFCNIDNTFTDTFERSYFSVYGKSATLCKYKRKLPSGKTITDCQIHTRFVLEDLKSKGLDKKSSEKEVPKVVLMSSKKVQRAFLRALFEGDGSVYLTKDAINIAYSSKSIKLLKEIQILLLNFGIISRIHSDRNNYRLIISGHHNVKLFHEKIGFLTTKQKKLEYLLSKLNSKGTVNSKTDFIPFLADYIRRKYKNKGYNEWLFKHNIDRYNKLEIYRDKLALILDSDDLNFIDELLRNRYYFAKVKKVEYTGKKVVYSIKVDSNCHSFVANGIINHNTEARLTKLAVEMLEDIEKNTVDMMPNFDASLQEPTVLPSKFPNLICNGTSGIAVGLATSIPPHNFKEVGEALKYLAQFPDATEEELCQFIKGPDFPTGGVITTPHEEIVSIYKSARGSITVKGKARIEKLPGNRQRIVIYEIPYQVNKVELIKKIAELVRTGKEKGISDLRDESDRTGIRIVVDLKRDANPEKVLKKLYKSTPLEKSIPINLTVLVDKQPKVLSLREILLEFIKHRIEVITRRTQYELDKAKKRLHIVEGLIKALENPQKVIDIIRSSKDTQQAREILSSTFELSKTQADAILDMRLARFTSLESDKLREEAQNLKKDIARYETILAHEEEKIKVFIEEMDYMLVKYGDERKTTISTEQELTFKENFYFGITNFGKIANFKFEEDSQEDYIQKIINSFASRLDENEKIISIQKVEGSKPIAFLTNSARAFWSLVIDLPKGEDRVSIEEEIVGTAYQGEGKENRIFIITKQGMIKRMFDEDIFYKSQNHLVMPLADGDEVVTAFADQENTYIGIYTNNADLLLFERNEVRVTGDKAKGVEAIDMDSGDEVAGAFLLNSDKYLLIVTQHGYMKLVDREEIPIKKRGQKGVMVAKLNKDDRLCGVVPVNFGDTVIINTSGGKVLRVKVDQETFPVLKRTATGERKFNFEAEKIIKVLKV